MQTERDREAGARAAARTCDVCLSAEQELLYTQRFVAFDDRSAFEGYAVVACGRCGFTYASGIPGQETYDRYYRDMSKYESHENDGSASPTVLRNNRAIVAEIAARVPDRSVRILDVGSGAGHLLAAFREAGYSRVQGFDPSPRCAEIAATHYGLEVRTTPLGGLALGGERFDLILLSSVLEHLRDLRSALAQLTALLSPGGAIWFEVPDADRFAQFVEAPFQQFSLEHINFFTGATLCALLQSVGFVPAEAWRANRELGATVDPALDGIFRAGKVRDVQGPVRDESGASAVRAYVARSEALEDELFERLSGIIAARSPVLIWGTGTLTLHLLAQERFRGLNLRGFIDSNTNYQAKTILGLPIFSPASLRERTEAIVIVSRVYEAEIARTIARDLQLANPVVPLFGTAAPE